VVSVQPHLIQAAPQFIGRDFRILLFHKRQNQREFVRSKFTDRQMHAGVHGALGVSLVCGPTKKNANTPFRLANNLLSLAGHARIDALNDIRVVVHLPELNVEELNAKLAKLAPARAGDLLRPLALTRTSLLYFSTAALIAFGRSCWNVFRIGAPALQMFADSPAFRGACAYRR
jgi:hypothetical protein